MLGGLRTFSELTASRFLLTWALIPSILTLSIRTKVPSSFAATSNKGGDDFQMLDCGGQPLYHAVAKKVEQWNTTGQLGLVIGGTYPKELASVRALTPELNFLVPGIGAQGGDINACVQSGMNAQKTGMVINSSRAILYASSGEDFKEKARAVAMQTRDAINAARGL